MSTDSTPTQFDYLYNALANSKYGGLLHDPSGERVFQFAAAPLSAAWQTGSDAQAYAIANAVPISLDGFYAPGSTLDMAYQDLISSVEPANDAGNADYKKAVGEVKALSDALQATTASANAAWKVYQADNPGTTETVAQWMQDPLGGASFASQLESQQDAIAQAKSRQAAIARTLDAALSRAQLAVNDTANMMNLSIGGGPVHAVPLVTIEGDLAGDRARWIVASDGEYDLDVTVSQSDTITTPWKTLYTTTTHADCLGANTTVNVNMSRIITDVNYSVRFSAVGFEAYAVSRGAWYAPAFVRPDVQLMPGGSVTPDTFFGLNGSLHLIPTSIVVMYKPTIQVTVTTEIYEQEIAGNLSADVEWVNIFGCHFAVDGAASLQPVQDKTTTTVTFKSPSDPAPQILGVVSQAMWNGHSAPASLDA